MSARKEEQELVVHMRGKGFKKFNHRLEQTIYTVQKLNKELKKANRFMTELIDLDEKLKA